MNAQTHLIAGKGVWRCEAVGNEMELVELAVSGFPENMKRDFFSFWCTLNVHGKPAFKGFDFAYILMKHIDKKPVLQQMQLFQATVNPWGKSRNNKLNMTNVLQRVKVALINKKLVSENDADNVVVPYIVHPSGENDNIELPCSHSNKPLNVKIIGFPQRFLEPDHARYYY